MVMMKEFGPGKEDLIRINEEVRKIEERVYERGVFREKQMQGEESGEFLAFFKEE